MIQYNNVNKFSEAHWGNNKLSLIYYGEEKIWPEEIVNYKFHATYLDGSTYGAACDSDTVLRSGTTKPVGYRYNEMTTAIIGDCVTIIGASAFSGYSSLSSVTIPSTVDTIGRYAFLNTSITGITIPFGVDRLEEGTFYGCGELLEIVFPYTIRTIGEDCFYNCASLTSVTIPSSITSIGTHAFGFCTNLASITFESYTPPTLGTMALDDTNNCPIFVPCESMDAYKTAWSVYADRIQCHQVPINEQYFTVTNFSTRSGIYVSAFAEKKDTYDSKIYYRLKGDREWILTRRITESSDHSEYSVLVPSGSTYEFKADITDCPTTFYKTRGMHFLIEGTSDGIKIKGNVASMFFGDNFLSASQTDYLENVTLNKMFSGNPQITDASELYLPSEAISCTNGFQQMFDSCSGLRKAPELPATIMKNSCYLRMFYCCSSLTEAPELPATTLANGCYDSMFAGCTSLTVGPELPATTLATSCYQNMFWGCTALLESPELKATTLPYACYMAMFYDCRNLKVIRCYATSKASNSTMLWANNVASSGTFYAASTMSWLSSSSGIPNGWTRVNI